VGAARAAANRVLVAGWFSLDDGGATAGDLAALDVVRTWLDEAGRAYDVALAQAFDGGVHWRAVRPGDYGTLVLVCGPVSPKLATWQLVTRFASCRLVALDVSVVEEPNAYSHFAAVLARDGLGDPQPDLAFAATFARVPVVGVLRVHPQLEYGKRGRHVEVDRLIAEHLASRPLVVLPIDTQLDANRGGLRNATEVAALVAKADAVVTTRLHGLVFALRAGVPAAAIDPVAGGAKVAAQARAVGWPHVITADEADDDALFHLLDDCLDPAAGALAVECAARARNELEQAVRPRFMTGLGA
jgi:polysaccharide pyruvyl transferase